MGIKTDIVDSKRKIEIPVLVEFMDGTQGDFTGTFERPSQDELDEMMDPEQPWSNSDVLDKYLTGVSGIGTSTGELPPEEQLAWVRKTPECVSAAVAAFFKKFRPVRYGEKTSKPRRSRG